MQVVIWRLTALGWAGTMFFFSTAGFGVRASELALTRTFSFFHLSISPAALGLVNVAVRKSAHVIEYAIFSLLIYRCFLGRNRSYWHPVLACWCVVTAAVYSLSDELHQAFVPGRGASIIDCCIDTSGAVIAMLLVYVNVRFLPALRRDRTAQ